MNRRSPSPNRSLSAWTAAVALACAPSLLADEASTSAPEAHDGVQPTRQVLEAYWADHDPRYVAVDAVFTMMPSGEEIRGREAIAQHLDHFYDVAFDAHAERVNAIFEVDKGLLEATVVGKHTGEFAGVAPTGRDIRVPISVAYELRDGLIQRARVYLMLNVLLEQITSPDPR